VQESVASIVIRPSSARTRCAARKAVLIHRRTGNVRGEELLLGHLNVESTVRYHGIEVDDAIEVAEKIDI
jgi:hypothetical protein